MLSSLLVATSLVSAQQVQPSFGTRDFNNAGCSQLVPAIQNMIPVVSAFRGCAQQGTCQQLSPVIVQRAKIVRAIGGQCLGQDQASAFDSHMNLLGQCGSMDSAQEQAEQMQAFLEQLAQELQNSKVEHREVLDKSNQLQNQVQNHEQMIQQLHQSQQFQQQGQNTQFQNLGFESQQNQNSMFQNAGYQGQGNLFQSGVEQGQDNQLQMFGDSNLQSASQDSSASGCNTRGINMVLARLKPQMEQLTSCAPRQCRQLIPQISKDLGMLKGCSRSQISSQIQGNGIAQGMDNSLTQGHRDLVRCGSRLNTETDLQNLADVARRMTIVLTREYE